MGPLVEVTDPSKALFDAGNNLLKPHSSTDDILNLLDEIETLLASVEQDPTPSVQAALCPSTKALVSADFLRNPDSDVRVFVVSCLTEIMRITAPEAPYNDDVMKEIFRVTIEAFGKLADASCRSYRKAEIVLETVSKVRSSLVMLDLECDDLILEMFRQFLKIIRPDHPHLVFLSMETVMNTVIEESEEVSMDLLEILLTAVKKESPDVSPTASKLVERVLSNCAHKLQPCIMEALKFKGTNLDMYSPVLSSICQSESATTQAHYVVNTKENEPVEQLSEKQVVPCDLLEEKLDLGLSRKGNRSKRIARTGNNLKQPLKQGQSESTDAETESGSTRKRGRKPNTLMNPDEGYPFKTSSSKKTHEKELGDLSRGKLAANKASLPAKVGLTNQSVVISLSSSSKAGSRKRSRTKMEETINDVGSIATPSSKKPIRKKDNPEEDSMEVNLDKPEGGIKTARSSKKERAQNGSAKTSVKKPRSETKMVKTSGKKSVHSDVNKTNSKGASMDTPIPGSSKLKKKNSSGMTPSTKKSEQTPKSRTKRKSTAGGDVESNIEELGEELVGKKVNVWWPLDKQFYEGVVVSYSSHKKTHQVSYSDGDIEELNLKKERFEIIKDHSSATEDKEIDLPETIPLSDLIQRQKAKKRKKVSMNVEPSSPPEVRSIIQTTKTKDTATDSTKQVKSTKVAVKAVSNEPESRGDKNLKSLNEVNGEPGRTKGRSGKKQKVTRAKHSESKKDCNEKETPETKGEDSLKFVKSDVEPDSMGEHQELPENQNAETKTEGEEQKSAKEPSADCETDVKERNSLEESKAEPKTDGEYQDAANEPTAEFKPDEEEHEMAEEANADPETDEKEHKSLKETNVEPRTEGEEGKSVKEPYAEPETKVGEKESAKEPTAETKLTENENEVENEVADDDETTIKEQKEESDTIPGSG